MTPKVYKSFHYKEIILRLKKVPAISSNSKGQIMAILFQPGFLLFDKKKIYYTRLLKQNITVIKIKISFNK